MQRLLLLVAVFFTCNLYATLPQGAIAEDWTLNDINGNTHSLYADYLDQGWSVVIDMSATWCGPCWTFHTSGTMEDIYDDYGPGGEQLIMPMMIEVDPNTNQACFFGSSGCNNNTVGNWSAGVNYPLFNPPSSQASTINDDYEITVFPTMYVISPSGYVKPFTGSNTSYSDIESWGAFSFQMENTTYSVTANGCGDDSIDLHPEGGLGSISYEWSNGETTEDISGLIGGDYYVTMTDDNGYQWEVGPIEVQGYALMTLDEVDITDVDCFDNATGSISVSIDGGSGSFSYDWSNGDSGSTVNNLFADGYDVTVTDNNSGCEFFDSYTVYEPDELEINYFVSNAPCGSTVGEVEFDNDGGTYPFTYDIDGNTYYNDVIELDAGTYDADITDANGCTGFASFTIGQDASPTSAASASGSLSCTNSSITLNGTGSSTGSSIVYTWTDANGNNVGSALSISVSNPGNYTLTVEDSDSGCSSASTVGVTSNTVAPTAAASSSNNLTCSAPTATLSASGSTAGANITYLWTTTNGTITGSTTGMTTTISSAGTYNVLVTDTSNGCASSSSVNVTQTALPSISSTGNTSFCQGQSSSICVPVGANESIEWVENGVVVGTSSCYTASSSTTYIVNLTNTNSGCTVSQTIQTTANSLPSSAITGNTSFCTGASTTLCYSPEDQTTYQWMVNGTPSGTAACITVNTSANVELQATRTPTGCTSSSTMTTVQNSLPTASIAVPGSIDCNNSSTVLDLSTNEPNSTFTWYDGAGTLIGSTEDITVSQAGTYTAYVTNANGCGASASVAVTADTSVPVASIAPPAILDCSNSSALLDLSVNNSNYSISWIDVNGTVIGTTEDITVTNAGQYTAVVTNVAGCETEATVIVTADTSVPSASIAAPSSIDCTVSSVVLNATTTNGTSYTWVDASGTVVGTTEDITVTSGGQYTLTVGNASGCETEATVMVTANTSVPSVAIATPSSLDCNVSSVVLDATVSNGTSYSWTDANGNNVGTSEDITVTAAGEYTLTVLSDGGCSTTNSITVAQINNGVASPEFSFSNVEFNFVFTDASTGSVNTYNWDFGDGNVSSEASPIHTYTTPGYYNVCLETTNECGTTTNCKEVLAVTALTSEAQASSPACAGDNGSAEIIVGGGLPGYTYEWSDPNITGNSVTDLPPGDYNVIVTDLTGAQTEISFTISEPEPIIVDATITDTPANATEGSISLNISGGSGSYSIEWADGGDGTNLAPGDYEVTVIDEYGCAQTFNYTVESLTSTNEIPGLTSFTVSPNPSANTTTITANLESSTNLQVSLVNMLGQREVLTQVVTKELNYKLDVSALTAGIYFVELRAADKVAIQRIMVAR